MTQQRILEHASGTASHSEVEALEHRCLFAGNVAVFVDPATGVVQVIGDRMSNKIQVALVGDGFDYEVRGLNGTTVNDVTSAIFPVGGSGTSPFYVTMGNGHDLVKWDAGFFGDVTIRTGSGDDKVTMWASNVGNLIISTGNGNDHVNLQSGLDVFADLNVNTGNGSDTITLPPPPMDLLPTVRVTGAATLDGGRGGDLLIGEFSSVGGTETTRHIETLA